MNVSVLLLPELPRPPPPKWDQLQGVEEVTAGPWEVATLGSLPRALGPLGSSRALRPAWPGVWRILTNGPSPSAGRALGCPLASLPGAPCRAAPLPATRPRSARGGAAPGTCSARAAQGRARETRWLPRDARARDSLAAHLRQPRIRIAPGGRGRLDAAPLGSGAPFR